MNSFLWFNIIRKARLCFPPNSDLIFDLISPDSGAATAPLRRVQFSYCRGGGFEVIGNSEDVIGKSGGKELFPQAKIQLTTKL